MLSTVNFYYFTLTCDSKGISVVNKVSRIVFFGAGTSGNFGRRAKLAKIIFCSLRSLYIRFVRYFYYQNSDQLYEKVLMESTIFPTVTSINSVLNLTLTA